MFEMWGIKETIMLMVLMYGAWQDLRKREVPLWYLITGTVVAIGLYFGESTVRMLYILAGISVGLVFLAISRLTEENLGYADSWMILNLGIFPGIHKQIAIVCLAFFLAAFIGAAGMIRHRWNRKTSMPFLPFLAVGFLGAML